MVVFLSLTDSGDFVASIDVVLWTLCLVHALASDLSHVTSDQQADKSSSKCISKIYYNLLR